jgi:hypothetical protein
MQKETAAEKKAAIERRMKELEEQNEKIVQNVEEKQVYSLKFIYVFVYVHMQVWNNAYLLLMYAYICLHCRKYCTLGFHVAAPI